MKGASCSSFACCRGARGFLSMWTMQQVPLLLPTPHVTVGNVCLNAAPPKSLKRPPIHLFVLLAAMRELVHVQGGQCTSARISNKSCFAGHIGCFSFVGHFRRFWCLRAGGNQIGAKFWEAQGLAELVGWIPRGLSPGCRVEPRIPLRLIELYQALS